MAGNSIGQIFRLTTFGESHGIAIGGVIDGCPAGLSLDLEQIRYELQRRKPGQSVITTQRKEDDEVEFLSGIFEGKTTGTPIGFVIKNKDQKSKDYSHIKDSYRPSHADYTYQEKYGIRDYRGGGRSSARETACRVVAGAIAKQILHAYGVDVFSYVSQIHNLVTHLDPEQVKIADIDANIVRCPDKEMALQMEEYIKEVKKAGDSVGGVITGVAKNVPVGLGEPVFDKLHAEIGKAMLSINAVKGFEIGSGFGGTFLLGSEHNDEFISGEKGIETRSNNSGGIQGGISNGELIYFNVAFKPTATIIKKQNSVDKEGNQVVLEGKGRHDPCVLPRAVPIVDAMLALTLVDHILRNKTAKL
ncbi:MAG: chorismate synthase [Flavobacteriales bacterium]